MGIRRDALSLSTLPIDMQFEQVTMGHGFERKFDFPISIFFEALQLVLRRFLPLIEVAHQKHPCGVGRPLSKDPLLSFLMQTEIEMSGSKLGKGLSPLRKFMLFLQRVLMTPKNSSIKGLEPRIVLYDFENRRSLVRCLFSFRAELCFLLCRNFHICLFL